MEVREQVMIFGIKRFDTFKDREGNTIQGGCTIEYGIPYSLDNENKKGYELKKYTFRENKDLVFDSFVKVPCFGLLIGHRENSFSNPIIDNIEPKE